MDLSVKLNRQRKTAKVVFAEGNEFGFLEQWRNKSRGIQHPRAVNAIEIAELAKRRYTSHNELLPYARTVNEFDAHIGNNPYCEVACLVFLKCDWFPDCEIIGLSHFRRTWCNNIVLDYLCSYPLNAEVLPNYPHDIRGIGVALLYFVVQVARKRGAELLWGEATQGSFKFYKDVFELASVDDLIHAPKERFVKFSDKMESSWAKDQPSQPDPVLERIYEVEANNPPFVGVRMTASSPHHQLVQNFLDLAFHLKMEIAQAFGVQDKDLSDSDLIRRIYRLAEENGRLTQLWQEIESRHGQGKPDKNPFK